MLIKLDTFLLIHVFNMNFSKKFYKKEKKSICGCILSMNDELWANGFKLYGPHIIFTFHFGKTRNLLMLGHYGFNLEAYLYLIYSLQFYLFGESI